MRNPSSLRSQRLHLRYAACLTLFHVFVSVSLAAQQLKPRFVRWELPVTQLSSTEPLDTDRRGTVLVPRRDYRHEGLAFGGIVFGAAGAWIGWNVAVGCPLVPGADCQPDRLGNAVAVGLAGAAVGGGLGYLVGRLSSKPYPNQPAAAEPLRPSFIPDSTRRRVGYHHWEGAAIGAGAGALLGTLLVLGACISCADCNLTGGDFLRGGLGGAGLGGAFGFLVGLASPKYESRT